MGPARLSLAAAAGLLVTSTLLGGSVTIEELPASPAVPLVVPANGRLLQFADASNPIDAEIVPTSFPVYEAFDAGVDDGYVLYRALADGIPSGDAYLEERASGVARKVADDLILEATRSPANPLRIAYIYAAGDGFGLAVADLASGAVTRFRERDVLPEFLAWDDSGSRVFFYEVDQDSVVVVDRSDFEVRDEIPYALPSLRLADLETGRVRDAKGARVPARLPVLREGTEQAKPPAIVFTDEPESKPERTLQFELREPGGRRVLRGDDLTHATRVFARSRDSARERPVVEGKLVAALPTGGLFRVFSGDGSSLVVIDWDGHRQELPETMTAVGFYLPLSVLVVAQGGGDYPPPGNCNLSTHGADTAASYAYDMYRSLPGAHIFASAPGLVVYTHSTTNCNSCDTGGDCPDRTSSCASNSGLGNTVTIEHADGSWTKYSHMQTGSIQVALGAPVCAGRYLGNQGHTGCTFGYQCGDHVHFQRQASASLFADSTPITFVEHPSGPLTCTSYTSSAFETSACGCQEPVIPLEPDAPPYAEESCQGYSKVFSFFAVSGTTYLVTLTPQSGNTDLFLSYSMGVSPSSFLEESTQPGTAIDRIQFGPPESGFVYIAAYGVGPGPSSFTIQVDVGCVEPVIPLTMNAAPYVDEACAPFAQTYSYSLTGGRDYLVTLVPISGNSDLFLDSTASVSRQNNSYQSTQPGMTPEIITVVAETSGQQFAAVDCPNDQECGYSIRVQDLGDHCPLPAALANPSPGTGDMTCTEPVLSWAPSARATSYDVFIDAQLVCSGPATVCAPGSMWTGVHQWWVQAHNACGTTPGPLWTFNWLVPTAAPVPTSPGNGSLLCGTPPSVSWSHVNSATSYSVYVDGSLRCSTSVTGCYPGALAPGAHTWYVAANNACNSSPSPTWGFTLLEIPTPPATPVPEDGAVVCESPALAWAPSVGPSTYTTFVDGEQRCVGSTSACDPGPLDDGYHVWYVLQQNACGNSIGSLWWLEVDTSPPDTAAWEPLMLTWDGTAVRLDWGVVETASGYRVYRDSRPDSDWGPEQRLHPDPIPATTWTDATVTGDIEFYRVHAVDDCGRERP